MLEPLLGLVDIPNFRARWEAGPWTPGHGWLHIGSDLAIWAAYCAMLVALVYFVLRRRGTPARTLFWALCFFLFLCASVHLVDALMFWWPGYQLLGVVKLAAAAASWVAVVVLAPTAPKALDLHGAGDLEALNEELRKEIAERHRVERALARERDLLHILMDTLPDYIYFKDRDSRFIRTNRSHAALLRLKDPADARGKDDFDFFPEVLARDYYSDEQEIIQSGKPLIAKEEQVPLPTGGLAWLSTTKVAMRDPDGRVTGIVGVSRDITEQKKAEEALKNSEAVYHSLVENLPLNVFRQDLDGRHTFANKAYCESLDRPLEGVLGQTDFDFFPAELAEKYRHDDMRIMGGREVYRDIERHVGAAGEQLHVEVVKAPVYDFRGEVVGVQGAYWDVTDRVLAQERLKETAEELKRSNEELERFASVASHDLQEPLRKIQAFGDRLQAKCGDVLSEQGRDYLERMQNAAARMRTLINDLLTFSRVTTRGQPFSPVDLAQVAREVLSDLEVRIGQTGARVDVGDLPTVDADSTQMRQLFQNLIGNALKFQLEGKTPHVQIRAVRRDADAMWEITVQDNGIGFDAKHAERIFGIFQRLHGRGEYEGTGIGLAVCEKIIARHGGAIEARGVPGEGATFVVSLHASQSTGAEQS